VMKEDPFLVDPVKTMRYVVEVLNELGLRADLKVVRVNEYWDTLYGGPASSGDHPQVYLGGWASDYLGSATFIADQFKCGAPNNISGLCSDSLDAKIEEAQGSKRPIWPPRMTRGPRSSTDSSRTPCGPP
jgi:ABC-type transport system substrate-binding protein